MYRCRTVCGGGQTCIGVGQYVVVNRHVWGSLSTCELMVMNVYSYSISCTPPPNHSIPYPS